MKPYIIKRILSSIPLLLIISFVCFVFINLIPSDPAEVALRVRQVPIITEDAIAEVRAQLGLDKPYLVRYFTWVLDCLHGNFGISYVNPSRTVAGELLRCMPATLQLAGASLIMVILLSLPIGFLCAVYKDGWFDRLMRGLVFMTTAMPPYWVGLLLMWLISIKLDLLPTSGNGTIRHLILPAFTVSLSYISTYIRLIRNNMLENMKQDYVLYANVRGLPQKIHSGKTYSEKLHAYLHCCHWYEYPAADLRNYCGRKCICMAWTGNLVHQFHFQPGLSCYPDLCSSDRCPVCYV